MSCRKSYYNPFFSHIYVEKDILDKDITKSILAKYQNSEVIEIDKYMDIFGRGHQDIVAQHKSQKLILARQTGEKVYRGSKNCQSFNHDYFYYTSNIMNCIFDCEYCYLKGMYPSANIVFFVNIEDTFEEIKEKLSRHPVYVSVSYNTDLIAMEQIFGVVKQWEKFVKANDNLTVEVRTKCANIHEWDNLEPDKNMIYAFTISPAEVINRYEKKTPAFEQRLKCIKELLDRGFQIRLCYDPMIYCDEWEKAYSDMLKEISDAIDLNRILDFSIGSFRISQDYMKNMRRLNPDSAVAWFPYENINGVYQYPEKIKESMQDFLLKELLKYVPMEKIFCWEGV